MKVMGRYLRLMLNEENSPAQGSAVRCPHCKVDCGMERGDKIFAVGPDRDEYDSPSGTRGGWVELRGFCSDCGNGYSLVIANHKGQLVISIATEVPAAVAVEAP